MSAFFVKTSVKEVRVSLYKRGKVLHYIFYWKGTRYRESTGKSVERDARVIARNEVDRVSQGGVGATLKLSSAIEMYEKTRWPEESKELRENNLSFNDAHSRLNLFLAHAGDLDIGSSYADDITLEIQKYFDTRSGKCSGRTVTNDRLVISRFFKWVIGRRLVVWRVNPAQHLTIELPPVDERDPEPLTQDVIEKLLPYTKPLEIWPIVLLCLGCGLRPAEAIRVKWEDIDFERRTVCVVNKKGKKRRWRMPEMNSWVTSELEKRDKESALFQYNYFTAFDIMAAACKKAGVSASYQRLRQTACSRAIESGMELADYVLQFGHSLVVAERHYLKYGKSARRLQSLEALDFSKTATKSATAIS